MKLRVPALVFFLSAFLSGCMGISPWSPTKSVLEGQVGHNINEMLPAWKDSTPQVYSGDGSGKIYVYSYGYHQARVVTQVIQGVWYPPEYQEGYSDCYIAFYTNKEGVVTSYNMKTDGKTNHNSCGPYISGYGF
jgi:hypothetical protein